MNRVIVDALQTAKDFDSVNAASELNWTFRSKVAKFIRRFWERSISRYRQGVDGKDCLR